MFRSFVEESIHVADRVNLQHANFIGVLMAIAAEDFVLIEVDTDLPELFFLSLQRFDVLSSVASRSHVQPYLAVVPVCSAGLGEDQLPFWKFLHHI